MFKRYSFPEDDCHGRILIMILVGFARGSQALD